MKANPRTNAWSVAIRRDDGTEFLTIGEGGKPIVWPKCNRSYAVTHKRKLRIHGFKARVVPIHYTEPEILTP